MKPLNYPKTLAGSQTDDYHGTQVADPYRWLEDTDSAQTREWIEAQNKVTFGVLGGIAARDKIRGRLTALWDFPKAWVPVRRGKRYFQMRNSGIQNQDVLYVMERIGDEPRLLLDPNTLSEDGTVALTGWAASPDGKLVAYATSASGSDWLTWRVRDVATGSDLPDVIEWGKFSGAEWRKDGSGFYYSAFDPPPPGTDLTGVNYFQKLYFHRLGDAQAQDTLVYERPDQKEWGFNGSVSEDGRYLIVHVWQGTDIRNRLFYRDLETGGEIVELISELEATYHFLGNDGPVFYLHTNHNAPRSCVIAVDTANPDPAGWRIIVPEMDDTLEFAIMIHDELVGMYLHDAHHQIRLFDLKGRSLGEIELPGLGSIPTTGDFLNLTGERSHDELFYAFWSFLHPVTVFRFDFKTGRSEKIFAPVLDFDIGPYVTRQVFVSSKDGARVPMYLTHRKDMKTDGGNPTLLYGYGGFNIALPPVFAVNRLVWLEMGGVLAWANLRGGGEYGEEWHRAGMLKNKQNVFDDFIACAEYLVDEKITSPSRLAIMGRSNGGLLVGACMTQRPDLFGAAIPQVGVMDMLRFHRFTIGWAWVSDYGSSEEEEQFTTLFAYSPLHNLKRGTHYPATLITTADHDDRVVPGHSFKYAAALQAAQAGDAPALIRIQTRAGHGFGTPTSILIEEATDIWAFLSETLSMDHGES